MKCLSWVVFVALRSAGAQKSCAEVPESPPMPELGSSLLQSTQALSRASGHVEDDGQTVEGLSATEDQADASASPPGYDIYPDAKNPIHFQRQIWDEGFPAELFYRFNIADNGLVVNGSHVFFPYMRLMRSLFARSMHPIDSYEFGVANMQWSPHPASAFGPAVKVGAAEKMHTILHDGKWTNESLTKAYAEQNNRTAEEQARARALRKGRAFQVNAYLFQTRMAMQLVYSGVDWHHLHQVQTYAHSAPSNEALLPRMEALRANLTGRIPEMAAAPDVSSSATNCLHFEEVPGFQATDDGFYMPLNSLTPSHKGQMVFSPVQRNSMLVGLATLQHNTDAGSIDLYLGSSSMSNFVMPEYATKHPPALYIGHADGKSTPILPPKYAPPLAPNPAAHELFKQLQSMPIDYSYIFEDPATLCPPEKKAHLAQLVGAWDAAPLMSGTATQQQSFDALELITYALDCVTKFMTSKTPNAHGYGILEAVVVIHAIFEFPAGHFMDSLGRRDWDDWVFSWE